MKTIGMLGGMSWESTQTYYRGINEEVRKRLGGLHSAKVVLYSVDFSEIEVLQHQGRWDETATILAKAASAVEAAGADFLIICTNTMHKVAPEIQRVISIPVLHVADAMADALELDGIKNVGLLGTRFTMEQAFYKERLERRGISVLVPDEDGRKTVHNVIYSELCLETINGASRTRYLSIIDSLNRRGAEAVILGVRK